MTISQEAIEAFALAFWPVNAVSKMESCSGDIAKALEAALPFLPIAVEGKVKALEWQRNEAGSWFAHTAFGVYLVNKGRWWIKSTTPLIDRGDDETAKSAAQADYVQRVLSCLASSPGKDGGQEVEAAQITMGRGLVDVTRIEHEGRSGILFRPRAEHIPVGEEGELQPGEYWPVKGDVVIWIENKGGARVIQNYLSAFMPSEQAAVSETSTAEKAAQIAERYNIDPWIVREIRALDTQPASTALVERLTMSADEIWIEPNPPADPNRGQDWSETNAWGQQATKYVRADIAETLTKALEQIANVMPSVPNERFRFFALATADAALASQPTSREK